MTIPPSSRIAGAIWGQFIGDAAALGAHWIYDLDDMARKYQDGIHGFEASLPGHYHEKKKPGDQTHYGDAALLLLDSVSTLGRFDENDFGVRFVHHFSDPACISYKDKSTQGTLANIAAKPGNFQNGADDDQLATVSRLAPVVVAHRNEDDAHFLDAIERCTRVTQNNATAIAINRAHGLLLRELLRGTDFPTAFEMVRKSSLVDCDTADYFEAAASLQNLDVTSATDKFGQSCPLPKSFPSALHCALKHRGDFRTVILATIRAGGDSAGRGAMIGAWLGASLGVEAIPGEWIEKLTVGASIGHHVGRLQPLGT